MRLNSDIFFRLFRRILISTTDYEKPFNEEKNNYHNNISIKPFKINKVSVEPMYSTFERPVVLPM